MGLELSVDCVGLCNLEGVRFQSGEGLPLSFLFSHGMSSET